MRLLRKIRALFQKRRLDAEMAEEMRLHLELQAERNRKDGLSADEARYAALRQFGNVASVQAQAREARGWVWLEMVGRDLRQAGRMLRKNPGFTAAATVSLALCIGANAAIFSMLYALVIKPLPYRDPARIVEVFNSFPKAGVVKLPSNFGQYFDFRDHAPAFAGLGLWRLDDYTLGDNDGPARVSGVAATAEIFEVLGVKPLVGRFFSAANHRPGADLVVVLTQSFWESRFQADPGVLGRTIRLDGLAYEIVGVAPRVLEAFDARAKFLRPWSWPPDQEAKFGRTGYSPSLYGRLAPNATIVEARAQVEGLEKQYYDSASPSTREFLDSTGHVIQIDTVQGQRIGPVKGTLYLLQGGVLFVLVIGCVNVANLLLVRSNARRGELATRMALGAGRGALARQLLFETMLLAWLGTALGLVLARTVLGAVNRFSARLLPDALPFALDGRLVAGTVLVATGLALVMGLLPIIQVCGGNLLARLHGPDRGASGGRGLRRMSSVLVVGQVAIALILLAGAGLLLRSFGKVLAVDPGFDPRQVVTARIALPPDDGQHDQNRAFQQRLERALAEVPGLSAGMATATPFRLIPQYRVSMPLGRFTLRDPAQPAGGRDAYSSGASPSYLATMRIPLRAGRWFNDADTSQSRPVVVVDEGFARRYLGGRNAVGQFLAEGATPQKEDDWCEIVGVVGDVRHNGVEDGGGTPFLYRPLTQAPFYGSVSVFIRTDLQVATVLKLLRERVAAIDPTLPVYDVGTMANVISDCSADRRGIMYLLMGFATLALVLAAVGIYGVLAYDVTLRTREMGIRSALGATRRQIGGMIVRQGLGKAAAGSIVGLAGALALSHFIRRLLYGVTPTDPLAYAGVSLLLLSVALLACWLPARRAAKVNPITALRAE